MDAKEAEVAREKYEFWKAEFEIFLFVGAEEREAVQSYPNEMIWTEYADFNTFYLHKGFDSDMNRRLPVTGWYVGNRHWHGENLESANVLTAVTVDCQTCDGSGLGSDGNDCVKCEGDRGTLIEFEESAE